MHKDLPAYSSELQNKQMHADSITGLTYSGVPRTVAAEGGASTWALHSKQETSRGFSFMISYQYCHASTAPLKGRKMRLEDLRRVGLAGSLAAALWPALALPLPLPAAACAAGEASPMRHEYNAKN